jgi:hypothetical protein
VHCLQYINEYRPVQALFTNTLGLSDVTLGLCLDYLAEIKEEKVYEHDKQEEAKIKLLYSKLVEFTESGTNKDATSEVRYVRNCIHLEGASDICRSCFQTQEMIYSPTTMRWHLRTSCVWAPNDIQLPDKVSLATDYGSQKLFFQTVLGIKKPSLEMYMVALQKRALQDPDKESVIRDIQNICALNPDPRILQDKLQSCEILPVRHPTGQVEWMASTADFAITDHREYEKLLKDQISILDFTLEEVHSLKIFLHGLGLGQRYLSEAVEEETRVRDGVVDVQLTQDLGRKAFAICR